MRRVIQFIRRGARELKRAAKGRITEREPMTNIDIKPIADVAYPQIDLAGLPNPVPAILAAPEFARTCEFFADNPASSRSLVSALSQALLYAVIRNLKPTHVVEIGTFRGGTTEAMSRAVHANGHGTVHTVGPFDG